MFIISNLSFILTQLQKDLEEVKVLLEKATRKRVRDALTAEKSKIETEMKNKMQQKSQRKAELTENEKPAAVVAPITTGYTVKISNYGMACPSRHIQLFLPFMCIFFTGVSMLYNIVVSVVQHRESALGVLRSPLFGFPSYLGHHGH